MYMFLVRVAPFRTRLNNTNIEYLSFFELKSIKYKLEYKYKLFLKWKKKQIKQLNKGEKYLLQYNLLVRARGGKNDVFHALLRSKLRVSGLHLLFIGLTDNKF